MIYINDTLDFKIEEGTVISLGKFDGLHRGHEYLLESMKEQSNLYGWKTALFTFNIPPSKKTKNEEASVITTNEEKIDIFTQAEVDYLIECPFTDSFMKMQPEEFIAWLTSNINVKCFVVGTDFCFGYKRAGNYQTLIDFEEKYGYQTIVKEKITEEQRDISSTYIREELVKGNMEKVNHLLGYPYFIKQEIVKGNQLGRTIGIPTINMKWPKEKLLPPLGVYVSKVWVEDKWYIGVSNIGVKPTIEGSYPVGVETYIIDFCQDIYGHVLNVEFMSFIRPEMKFQGLDELKRQMQSDIEQAKRYYRNVTNIC